MVMAIVVRQSYAAATMDAMISGTVRDVQGTPQMGALVQLLRADTTTVATALSDDHGRYIIPGVAPGHYQIRATAAFFAPLLRDNVRLHSGVQSVVNLTLSALFEADNWLPAQRKRADEPVDDWKWTLRSTASRPLLRLVDPEESGGVSSSGEQAPCTGRGSRDGDQWRRCVWLWWNASVASAGSHHGGRGRGGTASGRWGFAESVHVGTVGFGDYGVRAADTAWRKYTDGIELSIAPGVDGR
jgi:hypothetical protein